MLNYTCQKDKWNISERANFQNISVKLIAKRSLRLSRNLGFFFLFWIWNKLRIITDNSSRSTSAVAEPAKYPHDHTACCYQLIVEGSLLEGLSEGKLFTFQGIISFALQLIQYSVALWGGARQRTRKPWKDSDDVKVFKLLSYLGF